MKAAHFLRMATLGTVAFAFLFTFAGCHSGHPDYSTAVYQTLDQHDLASVQVQQDRDKGVITLNGIVGDQARKDHAQQLAQQAAPGYTIQNDLRVDNSAVLGAANSNARLPDVQQMAHPPADQENSAPAPPKTAPHGHAR